MIRRVDTQSGSKFFSAGVNNDNIQYVYMIQTKTVATYQPRPQAIPSFSMLHTEKLGVLPEYEGTIVDYGNSHTAVGIRLLDWLLLLPYNCGTAVVCACR